MANEEMVKYTSLLQRDSTIARFKSSYEQCRVRSRTSNVQATDGEMMAVCAYLAGREVAGTAATRETCARLACMTAKTFDRVEDAIRKLLNQGTSRKSLTVTSLAEKYGFPEDDLEAARGVESALKYSITRELQDERVVCGVFSIVCKNLGYSSVAWLKEEAKIHDLDLKEVSLVTKRLEGVQGEQIETVIRRYKEGGRPSRRKQSSQKALHLSSVTRSSPSPVKRKAPEESLPRPSPLKRPKYSMESVPSTAPSSQRAASSVPPSPSEATSFRSSIVNDLVVDDPDPEGGPENEDGEPDWDEEYLVDLEDIGGLTWEDLAQARQKVLTSRSATRPPRLVFADRKSVV